jgi:hypothetical protein
MRTGLFLILILACWCADVAHAETVYFLVGEIQLAWNESYVLALSDPNDIAHARELIDGSGDRRLVVAQIECSSDCINRNYLNACKRAWSWRVTDFVGFADITIEILDGWAGLVEKDCEWWVTNTGGYIGFWNYTIVAELGTNPMHWQRDFDSDGKITNKDFATFAKQWLRDDCNSPDWCGGLDLDASGSVDYNDLRIFGESWLSPFASEPIWFSCWDCPYQCHGDADCQEEGFFKYRVYNNDVLIIEAVHHGDGGWPSLYTAPNYDPRADFDRDCDVDDDDVDILNSWFKVKPVPGDCSYCP